MQFSCCTITPYKCICHISSMPESMHDREIKTWTIIKRFWFVIIRNTNNEVLHNRKYHSPYDVRRGKKIFITFENANSRNIYIAHPWLLCYIIIRAKEYQSSQFTPLLCLSFSYRGNWIEIQATKCHEIRKIKKFQFFWSCVTEI